MKTFLLDIIPRIQKYSQKVDSISLISNQHWVLFDSVEANKTIYIFRANKELLISIDGKVSKGQWEYLGNDSILIEISNDSYLFKQGFFDKNILALKKDNKNEYAIFINENEYNGEINSLDKVNEFLNMKYLQNSSNLTKGLKYSDNTQLIKEINNENSENSIKSNNLKWLLGVSAITISIISIISYVNSNQNSIYFHIFNDMSVCPCGPYITQANPISDIFIRSLLGIAGIIFLVTTNKK